MNQKLCLALLVAFVLLSVAWSQLIPVSAVVATPTPAVTPTAVVTPSPTPIATNDQSCTQKYTSIGGVISGTLGRLGFEDVYCVTENLEVPVGRTLIVVPGTVLVFQPGTSLIVAGQLISNDRAPYSTRFISTLDAGWEGIHFLPSSQANECVDCSLENLATGSTALTVEAPLTFTHSLIRDVPEGVAISTTVPITLSNVVIDYVGTGLHLSGQSTVPRVLTHLTLTRCHQGIVNHGQTLALNNSIITNCDTAVSTGLSGTTTVSYTLFYDNHGNFLTEPDARLIQGPGLLYEAPGFVDFPENFRLTEDSPAVNAADPQADYSQEFGYNGGRADMGAYGNTRSAPQRVPYDQMAFTLTTDTPLLYGQPGETVTHTLTLKNNGTVNDSYSLWTRSSRRGQFSLQGVYCSSDTDSCNSTLPHLEPQEQFTKEIGVNIPTYATNGLFNVTSLNVQGFYTGSVELQLMTVVSTPTSIEPVGHLGISPEDVFVQDSYAYIAAGSDGLRIIDISDPDQPAEIGFYDLPDKTLGEVQSVAVAGNYAYLAAGLAGLRIVDISDPTTPIEVGAYEAARLARTVTVAGNYAFIVWDKGNICIVDISNPVAPVEVATYKSPRGVRGVTVVGDYAYLAAGQGLRIVNIAHPAEPVEARLFDQEGYYENAQKVVVINDYAYLATDAGLRIIEVSNPMTPVEVFSNRHYR